MRFGKPYPHDHLDHPVKEVRGWTRKQFRDTGRPMHQRLREAEGDNLALRQLILRTHGRETLANFIRGDHDLPNRY